MLLFITAVYKRLSSVVRIKGSSNSITYSELVKSVKDQFDIVGNIKFYDSKASAYIADEDVVDYIMQFKSSPGWTLGVLDHNVDEIPVNVCDDNCEAFKFIQEYNEPFDEVLENWKRSFAVRWNILEDNKVETADYLAKFPIFILNNSNIFKLFLEDSKMLHPDIALNIDWQICNKVLENGSHLKDPTVKKWITASLNCSEENRKAIGLLVLPYLFPSTKIKARQGKQSFKASKLEIQEKFILYFRNLNIQFII
ncbi:uncharacterized protein LOC129940855 [Eupeodes corollae]|uniref:uncharacterized protein LOC129940855 n=1 Tax=Eupeodes corollae TaxID=290404 RepID=UPI002490C088|nr:uncharacterized protein LOC129940855 [Eupeodes corollae]